MEITKNYEDPKDYVNYIKCNIIGKFSLFEIGTYLFENLFFDKSIFLLELCFTDLITDEEKMNCFIMLGSSYENLSNYKQATFYTEQGLDIAKQIGNRKGECRCYVNLGSCGNNLHDYKKAITYLNKGLDIAKQIGYRQVESECYINLGYPFNNLHDYKKAMSYLNKGLDIAKQIGYRQVECKCYNNLGVIYFNNYDYEKAKSYYEQGLDIAKQIGYRQVECKCYNNLGIIYDNNYDYEKAKSYSEQGLDIAKQIGYRQVEFTCYINLGGIHHFYSNYEKAMFYYEEALNIAKDIGDRRGESTCYANLGLAHENISNYKQAIFYNEQSLILKKKINDKVGQARCYNNLGSIYNRLNNPIKAISYLNQAINLTNKSKNKFQQVRSYIHLGSSYHNMSNYEKAIFYHEEALNIAKDIDDRKGESNCYLNLGLVYFDISNYEKAKSCFFKALDIYKQNDDKYSEYLSRYHLGNLLMTTNELNEAYHQIKKSIVLNEYIGTNILINQNKVDYYALTSNVYSLMIDVCIKLLKRVEAFEYVERSKSKAFLDLMSTSDIKNMSLNFTPLKNKNDMKILLEKEEELLLKKKSIQMRYNKNFNDTALTEIIQTDKKTQNIIDKPLEMETVLKDLNEIYLEMEKIDPKYVSLRTPKHIKVEQVQKFLLDEITDYKSILVEYFITINRIFIFIITTTNLYVKEVNVNRETLYKFIDNYQQEVVEYPTFIEHGGNITNNWILQLSKCLIEPIIPYLKDINLIYFIPHDKLHYVPLQALLINREEPLIKKYKIVYSPSSSILHLYNINQEKIFIKTCTSFGVALNEYEQEFLEEAERVANLFDTKAKLDVTKEQVLRTELTDDVLHFSCHGYFYHDNPLSSGIVLKNEEYLTARDIFDKNLKINSKLVTLSACESGVSENKPGDELIGLTRSLLYAGAQSLVVSLWKVNSRAALEIMIEFYTNLKNGEDKATALQNAQIKIREEWKEKWGEMYTHPFWWAPFVLVGDWR